MVLSENHYSIIFFEKDNPADSLTSHLPVALALIAIVLYITLMNRESSVCNPNLPNLL